MLDAAFVVHSALGPGLLESAYEACLGHELRERGLEVKQQVPLPVIHRGVRVDAGYRVEMIVNDRLVVELETVAKLLPIHDAQLLSYLRLSHLRLGLLLNFHVLHLRDAMRRLVNGE